MLLRMLLRMCQDHSINASLYGFSGYLLLADLVLVMMTMTDGVTTTTMMMMMMMVMMVLWMQQQF